ncbi:MAG: hypothetical protein M1379_16650 [Firmicutes bacterium]|nr:hypothetical protein [Bacillota bacterium]
MYYDRKNIEPDYALDILAYSPRVAFNKSVNNQIVMKVQLVLQNYGRKPIGIVSSILQIRQNLRIPAVVDGLSVLRPFDGISFELQDYDGIGIEKKLLVVPRLVIR